MYPPAGDEERLPFAEAALRETPEHHRFIIRAAVEANGLKLGLGSSAASTVSFIGAAMSAMGRQLDQSEVFRIAQNSHHWVRGSSGAELPSAGGAIGYAWTNRVGGQHEQCIETAVGTGRIRQLGAGLNSILTVWTGRPASTRALVGSMHGHRGTPAYVDFMARLGAAAVEGACAWQNADRRALIDVMNSSAELLRDITRRLGITIWTPAHDAIKAIVGKYGAVKPTGAGGGDLAWVLGHAPADEAVLESRLRTAGYPCHRLMVSAEGVHLRT